MTTTHTVENASTLAEQLNLRFAAGQPMTVNSFQVRYPFRGGHGPFRAYRTGSISVWVRGGGHNNTRTVWLRAGETITVTS